MKCLQIERGVKVIKKWIVRYIVGNSHKVKYIYAKDATSAIKKARVKNIEDLYPAEEV